MSSELVSQWVFIIAAAASTGALAIAISAAGLAVKRKPSAQRTAVAAASLCFLPLLLGAAQFVHGRAEMGSALVAGDIDPATKAKIAALSMSESFNCLAFMAGPALIPLVVAVVVLFVTRSRVRPRG